MKKYFFTKKEKQMKETIKMILFCLLIGVIFFTLVFFSQKLHHYSNRIPTIEFSCEDYSKAETWWALEDNGTLYFYNCEGSLIKYYNEVEGTVDVLIKLK